MHVFRSLVWIAASSAWSSAAWATDSPQFGKPPEWVVPAQVPATGNAPPDSPVAILLSNHQIAFDRGATAIYSETAFKIQTPQGLAAGSLSLIWDPATETVTVHKLQVKRGDQLIDILESGQRFTTMRREANLEAAMIDGRLTANIQPEGLREGDVIIFASTIERKDPVLQGRAQAQFAGWNSVHLKLGQVRLIWPEAMNLNLRYSGDVPAARPVRRGGVRSVEISMSDLEPILLPKGAPVRFQVGRLGEASDFASWAEVAALLMPHYRAAASVPASGPLRDEVEEIRRLSQDPVVRTEKALALVQDRVRYVALLMGEAGYLPASASETWDRRFGDCKGKTALLVAILGELGIEAEPVLVNSTLGDMLSDRLPALSLFDHVMVHARIAGKSYWLDGTRTGDTRLADIAVPNFGWGLPLAANAHLVRLLPPPLSVPETERHIEIDARNGIHAPAAFRIEETYRRDMATGLNILTGQLPAAARDEMLRMQARHYFVEPSIESSSLEFDKETREFRLLISGKTKLNWDNGWYAVPTSTLAFKPDFERPAGALQEAPFTLSYPAFNRSRVTIRLPRGFARGQRQTDPIRETLAGVEYSRTVTIAGDVVTTETAERSLVPEIPYREAMAAAPRLRTLYDEDVYLRVPGHYRASDADLEARSSAEPASAKAFFERGLLYLNRTRFDEAIADFTRAIDLGRNDAWPYANRALAYAWKQDVEAAERDIAQAEKLDRGNRVALRARGLLAEQKGQREAAIEAYSASLAREPNSAWTLVRRAFVYSQSGKMDEAARDFDHAVEQDSSSAYAIASRGLFRAIIKDFAGAEQDIKAALDLEPDNQLALLAQSVNAASTKGPQGVVEIFSMIIERQPRNAAARLQRAQAYRELGENQRALADTDEALRLGSNGADVRLLRANIFRNLDDRRSALAEAELIISEQPQSDYALVAAANIYSAFGMRPEAMALFDRALAMGPKPFVYVNRMSARRHGDDDGKLADLDAALQMEPDNVDALLRKALLLSKLKRYDESLALYNRALEARPPDSNHWEIEQAVTLYKAGHTDEAATAFAKLGAEATATELNNLCWAKATAGILLDSAIEDCREALKLAPDNGAYLDSLGMALLKLDRLDEALEAYDQAVAKKTGSPSLMGRALTFARMGNMERARADRAEALKIDPDVEARFEDFGLKF